jgi:hypothetical protein
VSIAELGSIGELVAAVATILTLAYLALQIRQSNRTHQLTAVTRLSESSEKWIGQVVQDTEVLDAYLLGLEEPEKLSREQRARFNLLVLQLLRGGEAGWIQVQWGVVDSDYWAGFRAVIKHVVGSTAGRRAFDQSRHFLNPKFASEVERILPASDLEGS